MTKLGDVPCNGCNACCRSEIVALIPEEGDDVASYEHDTTFIPGVGEFAFLKHQKNGACIYLGRDGCTIRERRPIMCRVFDCRGFYLGRSRAERQALSKGNPLCRTILNAGHQRLKTLDASELSKVPRAQNDPR